jgi:hypothetical protein
MFRLRRPRLETLLLAQWAAVVVGCSVPQVEYYDAAIGPDGDASARGDGADGAGGDGADGASICESGQPGTCQGTGVPCCGCSHPGCSMCGACSSTQVCCTSTGNKGACQAPPCP